MDNFKIIKFTDGDFSLDVKVSVEDGTIWLSASEIAKLFNVSIATARRVIKSTYNLIESDVILSTEKKSKNDFILRLSHKTRPITLYGNSFIIEIEKQLKGKHFRAFENFIIKNQRYKESDNNSRNNNIVIFDNGTVKLDVSVSPKEETVWLTQEQIATLFETTQQNISFHIKNIFEEGELEIDSVHKDFLYTAHDNKQYFVSHYNLDLILAIGYRIKGKVAIDFRKWVTKILKDYLINGCAINDRCDDSSFYKGLINLNNQYMELKEELKVLKESNLYLLEREKIFFNGEYFDAFEFVSDILAKAKNNIKIVDPYFDRHGLSFLKRLPQNIEKKVYKSKKSKLANIDIQKFTAQYGKVAISTIDIFHDRFIIIDDQLCYALGTSLNHMGKRVFAVNQIETKGLVEAILSHLN